MWVRELDSAASVEEIGGKASGLARLRDRGVRVPESWVVSRAALAEFLEESSLDRDVREYLAASPGLSNAELQARFHHLSRQVSDTELSARVRDECAAAVRRLLERSPVGLAVRSSAVVEDGEHASGAGVFESYLGLTTTAEIVRHVKLCWCSLWSPRAVRYFRRMEIEGPVDGMAVILQSVVAARAAGVMLTADPRTGNPWELSLQATRGLSIDLMSGSGEGLSITVDASSGAVLASEGEAGRAQIRATRGGLVREESTARHTEPVVTSKEIRELAETARAIDEDQGRRMDIEWAIDDSGIWIVQARPLTALPEFFPYDAPSGDDRVWNLAPLFVAPRSDTPTGLVTPMYSDLSGAEHWQRYQPDDMVFTTMWTNERDVNGYRYYEPEPPRTFLDCFERPGDAEPWLEENEAGIRQRWSQREKELEILREMTLSAIGKPTPASAMVPVLFEVRDRLWDLVSFGWSGPQALGWMCEGVLRAFLEEHGAVVEVHELLCNDSSAHTLRVAQEYQRLGRWLRDLPEGALFEALPADQVLPRLRGEHSRGTFLAELETSHWSIGRCPPSWHGRPPFWWTGDDLQMVSSLKRAMNGQGRDAVAVHQEAAGACRRRCDEVRSALRDPSRDRFGRLLSWTSYWSQALNDRHDLAVGQLWERELVWVTGRRLVEEGVLDAPQDILVLQRADLEDLAFLGGDEARARADDRKREYDRHRRLTAPATLGPPRAEAAALPWESRQQESSGDELSGVGFVSGIVSGRARLVTDLDDAALLDSLRPDDIFVLPYADAFAYADWHSLLLAVAGVVAVGRPAHHLVQVARECRVPIVGQVPAAAIEGLDGSEISMDGSTGSISKM